MDKEFHMLSHSGFIIANPVFHVMTIWDNSIPEDSWANKKYNDLCWKIQRRKAMLKGVLCAITSLVVICAISFGLYLLAVWLNSPLQMVASAYLVFQLMRLAFMFCEEAFDPNNVLIKRRGRILY